MKILRLISLVIVASGPTILPVTVNAAPSADSITTCTIIEGGVDKGSNHTITFTPGVVQGTQPVISITSNDPSKYVGFEQGYVLKSSPAGTLFTGSQSINVFTNATFSSFDLTWYVDSQKFNSSNTAYPATTHGFQYRFFAVEGVSPYSYNSGDTPLCTLTYITPQSDDPGDGDPESGGSGDWDIDRNYFLSRTTQDPSSALPDTV
ncbi:MAG: hypothetical protein ACKOI2_01090 [Actinomycetota bacterium]